MRFLNLLLSFVLFFTVPFQAGFTAEARLVLPEPFSQKMREVLDLDSFDAVMDLIETVEKEGDKNYSRAQRRAIKMLMTWFAEQGNVALAPYAATGIQNDIERYLGGSYYQTCGWWSDSWNFVEKYKVQIVIGLVLFALGGHIWYTMGAAATEALFLAKLHETINGQPCYALSPPDASALEAMRGQIATEIMRNLNSPFLSIREVIRGVGLASAHDFLKINHKDDYLLHANTDLWFGSELNYSYWLMPSNPSFLTGETALRLGEYDRAVRELDQALHIAPATPEIYLLRALAHARLANSELADQDYNSYLAIVPQSDIEGNILDFASGFVAGLPRGAFDGGKDFLFFGKQLLVHPIQTARETYAAIKALSAAVKEEGGEALLQVLPPETQRLVTNWNTLSMQERGDLSGYTVGKLGTELVICPGGAAKLLSLSGKGLKHVVRFAQSLNKLEKTIPLEIASSSGKLIATEVSLAEKALHTTSPGRIIISNPNVIPHVMQPKHAWDRLIKLTGNKELDFGKVVEILEREQVVSEPYIFRRKSIDKATHLERWEYRKMIEGELVEVICDKNIHTGSIKVKDSWVKTRP